MDSVSAHYAGLHRRFSACPARPLIALAAIVLLCAAPAAAEHPSVLVSPGALAELQQQAATSHADVWRKIVAYTDSQLGTRPPSEAALPAVESSVPWKEYGSRVYPFAFSSMLTRDPGHAQLLRDWVLGMCAWSYWGPRGEQDGDLGAAHVLLAVSVGYDWGYDAFTAAERKLIEDKVAYQAGLLHDYATGVRYAFWRDAYRMNHNHINNVALGVAGIVFRDVVPQAALWKAQADANTERILAAFAGVGDGSYHEGYNYWSYTLTYVLLYLDLRRQHDGVDSFQGNAWLENAAYFRLYGMMPDAVRALDVADSTPVHRSPRDILRKLAAEYRNGYAEWLVNRRGADETAESAFMAPWEFLWYDPTVQPRDPADLPLSRHFSDWGVVVMRGGWGPNDTFISLKSGAPGGRFGFEQVRDGVPGAGSLGAGHDHPDQNSFTFAGAGQYLATDNGLYYKPKLTRSHNTILVNDSGQIGESRSAFDQTHPEFWQCAGSIGAFEHTGFATFASADASASYPSALPLTQFARRVLYARPDIVLMVDNLAATQPARFTWLLHNQSGQLSRLGKNLHSTVAGASLRVAVAEPPAFVTRIAKEQAGYKVLRLEPSEASARQRFTMVLTSGASGAAEPRVTLLPSASKDIGVRVDEAGDSVFLLMRGEATAAPSAAAMDVGGLRTDGAAAVVSRGVSPAAVVLIRGTQLLTPGDGTMLVRSSRPASVEVRHLGAELAIQYRLLDSETPDPGDWISSYAAVPVSRVTLNGVSVPFTSSGSQVTVYVAVSP